MIYLYALDSRQSLLLLPEEQFDGPSEIVNIYKTRQTCPFTTFNLESLIYVLTKVVQINLRLIARQVFLEIVSVQISFDG